MCVYVCMYLCMYLYTYIGSDGKWSSSPSPVFQYSKTNNFCHRLGGDIAVDTNYNVDIIDDTNPAAGIRVTYKNGDACPQDGTSGQWGAKNRAMIFYFECEDDDTPLPTTEVIDETLQCVYEVHVKSIYGCPMECPRSGAVPNDKVCTDHGDCEWDRDAKVSECMCDKGFYGNDCSYQCDNSKCNGRGFCEFDSTIGSAHCYCDTGYTGILKKVNNLYNVHIYIY